MSFDQFTEKSHSKMGALELNRCAREQQKYLHVMQATWTAENKPARVQKHSRIRTFFASLQDGLFLPSHQLVGASRK